jgi:hypothetical protein
MSGSVGFLNAAWIIPLCVRTQIAVSPFDTSRPTKSGSILLSYFDSAIMTAGER